MWLDGLEDHKNCSYNHWDAVSKPQMSKNNYKKRWNQVGQPLPFRKAIKLHHFLSQLWNKPQTFKVSISCAIQETGNKILEWWNKVPNKLHKIIPQCSPVCRRWQKEVGTKLHVFWSCPWITGIWKQVLQVILNLTDVQMPDDLAAFLLHLTPMSVKHYKWSLIIHLPNAAKPSMPLYWKPPPIRLWLPKVNELETMEELIGDG